MYTFAPALHYYIMEEEKELQPLRIIGTPKRKDGRYVLDEFAILNRECGWICPRCNNEVRICPTKAGEQSFTCKSCNATFVVRVDAEADTFLVDKKKKLTSGAAAIGAAAGAAAVKVASNIAQQQPAVKPASGRLLMPEEEPKKPGQDKPGLSEAKASQHEIGTDGNETLMVTPPKGKEPPSSQTETAGILQWGGFFSRKRHTLRVGANIIGRKDSNSPSDLEFDDPEMSRRSVKIDAIPDGNGHHTFTITVLKALNPVTLNGQRIEQGSSFRLNHNDAIVMGKTSLTFKNPQQSKA